MRYQISHTTKYLYAQPVTLQPQVIRLRPRSDGCQTLHSFSLAIAPPPIQQTEIVDLDGNSLTKVWFEPEFTGTLTVCAQSEVETFRANPFDYLLEPWATKLPADYPASLLAQLKPYLTGQHPGYSEAIDPVAAQLAQDVWWKANGEPVSFLFALNERIHSHCQYMVRETGDPLPPGITWTQRSGSCRDFTVLFVEACRAIGLAARFVSGYHEGDPAVAEKHLHAWAEVYVPGGGWRGYDPSLFLAVADRHIALVASSFSGYAAPISGVLDQKGVSSTMSYDLTIQPL